MKQNKAGKTFRKARMRLHRIVGRPTPISREDLAQMALEEYGPIQSPSHCRRANVDPTPHARWVAKIQALERKPGERALNDIHADQLCELLRIRRPENRDEIEFNEATALEAA